MSREKDTTCPAKGDCRAARHRLTQRDIARLPKGASLRYKHPRGDGFQVYTSEWELRALPSAMNAWGNRIL